MAITAIDGPRCSEVDWLVLRLDLSIPIAPVLPVEEADYLHCADAIVDSKSAANGTRIVRAMLERSSEAHVSGQGVACKVERYIMEVSHLFVAVTFPRLFGPHFSAGCFYLCENLVY